MWETGRFNQIAGVYRKMRRVDRSVIHQTGKLLIVAISQRMVQSWFTVLFLNTSKRSTTGSVTFQKSEIFAVIYIKAKSKRWEISDCSEQWEFCIALEFSGIYWTHNYASNIQNYFTIHLLGRRKLVSIFIDECCYFNILKLKLKLFPYVIVL